MNNIFIPAIIFYGIYMIFKNFTDFILKWKIIKTGHLGPAEILDQKVSSGPVEAEEVKKYPSLKWGLVAFFGGMGFILIDLMSPGIQNQEHYNNFLADSMLPFGIELVSLSLGFLTYFIIVNFIKKK